MYAFVFPGRLFVPIHRTRSLQLTSPRRPQKVWKELEVARRFFVSLNSQQYFFAFDRYVERFALGHDVSSSVSPAFSSACTTEGKKPITSTIPQWRCHLAFQEHAVFPSHRLASLLPLSMFQQRDASQDSVVVDSELEVQGCFDSQ